jgi:thiol:disulfide interchange protein
MARKMNGMIVSFRHRSLRGAFRVPRAGERLTRSMTGGAHERAPRLPLSPLARFVVVSISTVTYFVALNTPVFAQAASSAAVSAVPAPPPAPLPVDTAFAMTASFDGKVRGNLLLKIDVQPGHYLYRDRFEIQRDGEGAYSLDRFKQPADKAVTTKNDPHFGAVKVFDTPVTLVVGHTTRAASKLVVVYQGCSEIAGVCYPPTRRSFDLAGVGVEVAAKEAEKPGLGSLFKKNVSQ